MIRDKDKAMEIHQKFGHMHFQKILESVKRCVSLPEYDRITRSVIYHLKNIKCDKCALTRSNLIRHPVSKTNQRAQYFGQVIQCDVLYGPNRFKAKSTPLRLRLLPRHLWESKKQTNKKHPVHTGSSIADVHTKLYSILVLVRFAFSHVYYYCYRSWKKKCARLF